MDNKHFKRAVQNPFLPLALPIDMPSDSDESDSGEEEDNDTEEEEKFVKRQRLSTSRRSSGANMDEVHGFATADGSGGGGGGVSAGVVGHGMKAGRFPLRHMCKEGCLDKLNRHVEPFFAIRKDGGKPDLKKQNDMLLKIVFDDKGQCLYHSDCILRAFGISKGRLRRLRDRQQNNMAGNTIQHGLCGRRSNNSKRPETLQQFIDYVRTHRSVDHFHPQSKKPVYRLTDEMRCIQGDNESSLRVRFNLHQQTLAENTGEKNRESISSGTAQAWFKRYFSDTLKPCEGRTGTTTTTQSSNGSGQWNGGGDGASAQSTATSLAGGVGDSEEGNFAGGGAKAERSGGLKRMHHKTHGGATQPPRRISRTESGGGDGSGGGGGRDSRQSVPENSSSGGEGEGGSNNGSSTHESGNSSGNNDSSTMGGSYQSSNSNKSTDRSATSAVSSDPPARQQRTNHVPGTYMQYAGDGFDGLRALTEAAMSVLSEAADRAGGSPWSGGSSKSNSSGNMGNQSVLTNSGSECVQGQSLFKPPPSAQQVGNIYRPVSPPLD
eukprot:comp23488_c0_seq1/m.39298 comp23488_c0_seq1/g.39298  ORF comp23488_c0_seq1/g.39298 comp23488_c0_seq1/m.39298 type:complete len:548 (-) comp23488_c0_seq1:993-2636(-)